MAEFIPAVDRLIVKNEGGYNTLTNVKDDRGGMTYAGIARNYWPEWAGWAIVDQGGRPDADMVRRFYRAAFWHPVRGDQIQNQRVAETLFDFSVNAGTRTASVLAQTVVGVTPDGVVGPKTIAAINAIDAEKFLLAYALAKVARYAAIVTRDRSQLKFLLGWLNRTLRESA